MNELIRTSGTVLSAMPIGEQDKRIVLETCEFGKISAFARGSRRPSSPLLAASNPFATGDFYLLPGRGSYRLVEASIREYFRDLTAAIPEVYIGFYFLDLVDFYGRENIGGKEMLNLLYMALKALLRKSTDDRIIRAVFELRLLAVNGDYAPEKGSAEASMFSICSYITSAPCQKIFSFSLRDDRKKELIAISRRACSRVIDRPLRSLRIMEEMLESCGG